MKNSSRARSFTRAVLNLTNRFRVANGVGRLRANGRLQAAALGHSRAMANQDFFSHDGVDGSTPAQRAERSGFVGWRVGENIAAGYTTPKDVVQGWIDSPGHRANMLYPAYTVLGVGYVRRVPDPGRLNYGTYWTQLFGSMPSRSRASRNALDSAGRLADPITGLQHRGRRDRPPAQAREVGQGQSKQNAGDHAQPLGWVGINSPISEPWIAPGQSRLARSPMPRMDGSPLPRSTEADLAGWG